MSPSAYGQDNFAYTSPVAFSPPAPASQLPPPKKMRTAFFIDMKSNKGLSSATIQSTDIHKT
jgi:hypothetical protein